LTTNVLSARAAQVRDFEDVLEIFDGRPGGEAVAGVGDSARRSADLEGRAVRGEQGADHSRSL
jgi:hypothetical protein